jgi:Uma2 family endonuclease
MPTTTTAPAPPASDAPRPDAPPARRAPQPPGPYRLTGEQFMQMVEAGILEEDEHVELIRGHLIAMSPSNTPHTVAVMKATATLMEVAGSDFSVSPQSTYRILDDGIPEPDIVVFEGAPDDLFDGYPTPVLVVEVADTTLRKDRTVKQALYAEAGVPAYWILNLGARTLEVHRDPAGEAYATKTTQGAAATVAPRFAADAPPLPVADLLPAAADADA